MEHAVGITATVKQEPTRRRVVRIEQESVPELALNIRGADEINELRATLESVPATPFIVDLLEEVERQCHYRHGLGRAHVKKMLKGRIA